jgi:hypothetical protein
MQRKRKLVKKLQLKMAHPGDKFADNEQLFNAESLKDITDEVPNFPLPFPSLSS